MLGTDCVDCGADSVVIGLAVLLAILVVGLLFFFIWQVLLDPRIGSPLVFALKLAESIAILGKMSIKWPERTREFFDIIAVVNFNTDMFRLECLFGHPEPIKTATFTAISPAVAFLIGVLAFPLVRMVAKACSKQDKAANSAVEELCKPVISHAPLQFQPVDVLAVASFWQYICLLSVVVLKMCMAAFPTLCFTFIGLLIGCYDGEDGSSVMRLFPWLNCDEVGGRVAVGTVLTIIYCVGIPMLMLFLATQFRHKRFNSTFSIFLIRAVFSGHKSALQGMTYRIWTLLRSLSFVCISLSTLSDQQQALGLLLLLTLTMLLESIVEPRVTRAMSLLDRFEELDIFVVICLGMLHSVSGSDSELVYSALIFLTISLYCAPLLVASVVQAYTRYILSTTKVTSIESHVPPGGLAPRKSTMFEKAFDGDVDYSDAVEP